MRHAALTLLILLCACKQTPEAVSNSGSLSATIPTANEVGEPETGINARDRQPHEPQIGEASDFARIDVPGTLPMAFRGYWTGKDVDCAHTRSDMRLSVAARELRFYESVGRITAVEQAGPGAVIVDASYEGEGQSWTRRQRLSLSADTNSLTVANQGNAIVRKRCSRG